MKLNRTFVLPLIFLLICLPLSQVVASPPRTIFYQGRLTNDTGVPLDGTYDLQFRLYDDPSAGNQVWPTSGSESHTGVSVNRGVYSVYLGSNKPLQPADFGETLWLEVEVGGNVFSPRTELSSMPYAFNAYRLDGQSLTDLDNRYVDQAGDTMGGTLNMTGNDILLNGGWLSGDGDTALTITNTGDVGINTSNPDGQIHSVGPSLSSSLNDGALVLEEAASDEADRMYLDGDEINAAIGGGSNREQALYMQNLTTNDIYMVLGGGNVGVGTSSASGRFSVGSDTLVAQDSGMVGVNTASPEAQIHAVGNDVDASGNATLILEEAGEGDRMLLDGDEINAAIGGGAGNESALYMQNTNPNDIYMVTGGGSVGINTTSPNGVLDVSGDFANQAIKGDSDETSTVTDVSATSRTVTVETSGAGSAVLVNGYMHFQNNAASSRWCGFEIERNENDIMDGMDSAQAGEYRTVSMTQIDNPPAGSNKYDLIIFCNDLADVSFESSHLNIVEIKK